MTTTSDLSKAIEAYLEPHKQEQISRMEKSFTKLLILRNKLKDQVKLQNYGNASNISVEFMSEMSNARRYSLRMGGRSVSCPEPFASIIDKFCADNATIRDYATRHYVKMFYALVGKFINEIAVKLGFLNADGSVNDRKVNAFNNTKL